MILNNDQSVSLIRKWDPGITNCLIPNSGLRNQSRDCNHYSWVSTVDRQATSVWQQRYNDAAT